MLDGTGQQFTIFTHSNTGSNGALSWKHLKNIAGQEGYYGAGTFKIDASGSSAIYKKTNTVTVPSIKFLFLIKV